jgi:creatinine amidohydrolase
MPLGTDFLLVEHVSRAAAQAARAEVDILVAPTLPFGSSHHHLPFGGTLSMATAHYYAALGDLVASLITDGFRRVFIINGHGGNHEIVQLVARDLALQHPVNLAAASYWDLARAAVVADGAVPPAMIPGHAGIFETSLIEALRPELVRRTPPHRTEEEIARTSVPPTPFRAERAGFWTGIEGFTDSPDRADPDLGRRLLERIVPAVAAAFVQFARMPLVERGNLSD